LACSLVCLEPLDHRHTLIPPSFCSGYRKFEEWTKEYGPVFSLRQGTTITVVIGRLQAAIDIMEKEGAHTADRPLSISAGETLSGGMRLLLTPAGDRFKKLRRYAFSLGTALLGLLLQCSITVRFMPICSPRLSPRMDLPS
jgi:hypothetical protein